MEIELLNWLQGRQYTTTNVIAFPREGDFDQLRSKQCTSIPCPISVVKVVKWKDVGWSILKEWADGVNTPEHNIIIVRGPH